MLCFLSRSGCNLHCHCLCLLRMVHWIHQMRVKFINTNPLNFQWAQVIRIESSKQRFILLKKHLHFTTSTQTECHQEPTCRPLFHLIPAQNRSTGRNKISYCLANVVTIIVEYKHAMSLKNICQLIFKMITKIFKVQQNLDIMKGQGTSKNCSLITRFCYIKALFYKLYYYLGKENHSLHQGLLHIEGRYMYIAAPLYNRIPILKPRFGLLLWAPPTWWLKLLFACILLNIWVTLRCALNITTSSFQNFSLKFKSEIWVQKEVIHYFKNQDLVAWPATNLLKTKSLLFCLKYYH